LDNDKKSRADNIAEETDVSKLTTFPGINKTVLEILPELWEHQQYDDEYDLDSFLSTLKTTFQ
jgi:hypothetical protein